MAYLFLHVYKDDCAPFILSSSVLFCALRVVTASMTTVANTFGALEIGGAVSVFLFGVVTLQTHIYFQRFPEDRRYFKALVSTLLFLQKLYLTSSEFLGWRNLVNPALHMHIPTPANTRST